MKRFVVPVIAATLVAGPVLAQMATNYDELIRTRDITGGTIYTTNQAYDEGSWMVDGPYDRVDANWNDIGEIEDVILNKNGQLVGVVAEVGGFMDIGDKHVMLPLDEIKLVAVDDVSYAVVTRLSEEQLEKLESVDEGWWD